MSEGHRRSEHLDRTVGVVTWRAKSMCSVLCSVVYLKCCYV